MKKKIDDLYMEQLEYEEKERFYREKLEEVLDILDDIQNEIYDAEDERDD